MNDSTREHIAAIFPEKAEALSASASGAPSEANTAHSISFVQFVEMYHERQKRIHEEVEPHLVALGILRAGDHLPLAPANGVPADLFRHMERDTDEDIIAALVLTDDDEFQKQFIVFNAFLRWSLGNPEVEGTLVEIASAWPLARDL